MTAKNTPHAGRLRELANDLATLLQQWRPHYGAIEELFFSKNVKTALKVSEARGVILQTFAAHNIELFSFNPGTIKLSLTGSGRAEKKQMQSMVAHRLGIQKAIRSDDAADAIAAALCCAEYNLATLRT